MPTIQSAASLPAYLPGGGRRGRHIDRGLLETAEATHDLVVVGVLEGDVRLEDGLVALGELLEGVVQHQVGELGVELGGLEVCVSLMLYTT